MEQTFLSKPGNDYPIRLELRYKIRDDSRRVGVGQTERIGSRQLTFTADQPMQPRTMLEISISWPALLNHSVPLKLVLEGTVARQEGSIITVRVLKYQFRTRRVATGPQAVQIAAAPRPGDAVLVATSPLM